jgi:predicted Zn-dependent protease
MKREPMVFAVAGMVFGFVLGYMAAGMGDRPSSETHPRPADSALPRMGGDAASGPATSSGEGGKEAPAGPVDPDEVRTLESLATRDKLNVQVRIELGNLYMDHEQYEEAVRWYREALALKPDNNDVRVDMGASLLNTGKADEALAEFDHALKADPAHKKAAFNKGIALMRSGHPQEAAAVWEALLKRYPNDPQLQGLQEQVDKVRGGKAAPAKSPS